MDLNFFQYKFQELENKTEDLGRQINSIQAEVRYISQHIRELSLHDKLNRLDQIQEFTYKEVTGIRKILVELIIDEINRST
jgi:hypothetical protein